MTRATAPRWAWAAYLAGAAVLAALYSLVPPFASSGPVFNLLGLSPVVAILVGVRLQRPSSVAPWYLFAAGFALFWLGDLYTYSYPKLFNREVPFPSIGDGFYIAVYPVLMLGLLALVRKRSARSGDRSLIDATILTVGLALPSWLALIAPYLHDGSLTVVAKLVSVAYPLGDVLLLAAAIRLALDGGRRGPAFGLMSMSIVALLITDFVYGVMILNGTYDHQLSLDLGWVAFYVLFGAAALHPSMTSLEHAERRTRSPLTPVRLALLACASIIAPALELAHDVDRHDLDQSVVTGAALVLFGLVVVRMAGLMRTQERTQARERALSEEIARRQGEERLASLVRHSSDLITVVGADGLVTYQSPASERILGWTPEEVVGRSIHELIDPAEAGRLLHLIADGARGDGSQAIECALYHQDGTTRQFEVLLTSLLDDEHVRGIVLNSRDISERKAFERQLAHQAFHDPVTGLPNRALFVERVRHAIARGRREGRGLGVVFIDLDDFKIINDSLGHAAGDEVLQQVAQRLDQAVRASDTAARFGGDEFAVLLEDVDGVQEAADTAERIMDALGLPLTAGHNELSLRCSIGIAMAADGEPVDADELIRDADAAMYIAKRDGKGGYRVFEPEMHEGVLARLELRTDLQRALVEDQLELYFQPVVRLEDGSVSGVEALLRWNHPERGLVSPVQFIPLAEETGLIVPIGRWVLREGCRQGRELLRELPQERRVSISINLSLKQLQHSDIVADVRDALEESGLDPSSLTLEITESVLMADTDLAVTRLAELKALGIRLALDDFGTGYSSLSYLSKFPVDVLKMDRSFLQDGASPQQADLATAVVALGSTLSLEVVAEGIEMPEQWHTLRDLGCDLGQGFYFARPMNVAATREFLSGAPDQAPAADAP